MSLTEPPTTTITTTVETHTDAGTTIETTVVTVTPDKLHVVSPHGEASWAAPPCSRLKLWSERIWIESTGPEHYAEHIGLYAGGILVGGKSAGWTRDEIPFGGDAPVSATLCTAGEQLECARILLEHGHPVDSDTLILAEMARDEANRIIEMLEDRRDAGLLPAADIDDELEGIDVN